MDAEWFQHVVVRGRRVVDESMNRHCTWRAGGAADRYFEPADLDDLVAFMRAVPADETLYMIGLGSNLLVRDGGLRGTVVATGLAGWVFALLAERSGSLLAPMLAHLAINEAGAVAALIVQRGGK